MFTMDSTFIVNIGFTLLVAGIITYYIRQQIESSNHKISSMFSLVSSLTQELNELKKNMMGGNNVFKNDSSTPETVDGRIAVPSELKKIVISENNDSSDNEEDDSSDNEDDDEDDDDDDDDDEDDDEDDDDIQEPQGEPQEEHQEEPQEEPQGETDGEESQEESLQESLEESLEESQEENTENIKSIAITENADDFVNLNVPELRKLVSSKKLVSNPKNLKKQELLELLNKK